MFAQGVDGSWNISTHAPAGGATKQHPRQRLAVNISTHAPAGGATLFAQGVDGSWNISTHAPAGGATQLRNMQIPGSINFYSRPCGRGDHIAQLALRLRRNISTHAPAGGATVVQCPCQRVTDKISTHAPAGGATRSAAVRAGIKKYFYSRPCGRGDAGQGANYWSVGISTHAPAGGATKRMRSSEAA